MNRLANSHAPVWEIFDPDMLTPKSPRSLLFDGDLVISNDDIIAKEIIIPEYAPRVYPICRKPHYHVV